MAGTTTPPWQALPNDLVDVLRPVLDDVVPDIIATIQREVPEYSRPMEGRFGQGVQRGVHTAFDRFLELPGTTEPALTDESRHVYVGLGRGEVRQGRSLESLLAAYRTGARVVFRALAERVDAQGSPTGVIVALGESIFAYIDELSAASVDGYAREQSDRATDLERRRGEIVALLLSGGADEPTLHRLAAQAGWRLPEQVLAVVVPIAHAEGLRLALGRDCLVLIRPTETVAIVPATMPRTTLDHALRGRQAVVGPARPWAHTPESARLALSYDALAPAGGPAPRWVVDHLLDVILGAEPGAVADLATTLLAPLDAERPASRERLLETLASWLAHGGRRTEVADELHVHPQTVGYRLGRLRELFGDALDDPRTRFELEVVLRARAVGAA